MEAVGNDSSHYQKKKVCEVTDMLYSIHVDIYIHVDVYLTYMPFVSIIPEQS